MCVKYTRRKEIKEVIWEIVFTMLEIIIFSARPWLREFRKQGCW